MLMCTMNHSANRSHDITPHHSSLVRPWCNLPHCLRRWKWGIIRRSSKGQVAHCNSIDWLRTVAVMRVNHDGLRTVMARLGSLIRPNLISPWTKINWSPGHRTPSCDYAQDSPSSALLLLIHYIVQHVLYTLIYTYAHTDTLIYTDTHPHTHTDTHMHTHRHTRTHAHMSLWNIQHT